MQAEAELRVRPENAMQVRFELDECVAGLEWDAAMGGTDPMLVQEAQLWMSSLPS